MTFLRWPRVIVSLHYFHSDSKEFSKTKKKKSSLCKKWSWNCPKKSNFLIVLRSDKFTDYSEVFLFCNFFFFCVTDHPDIRTRQKGWTRCHNWSTAIISEDLHKVGVKLPSAVMLTFCLLMQIIRCNQCFWNKDVKVTGKKKSRPLIM